MITEGFVDGDLVERFLDLSQIQMDEVCKGLKVGGRNKAEKAIRSGGSLSYYAYSKLWLIELCMIF